MPILPNRCAARQSHACRACYDSSKEDVSMVVMFQSLQMCRLKKTELQSVPCLIKVGKHCSYAIFRSTSRILWETTLRVWFSSWYTTMVVIYTSVATSTWHLMLKWPWKKSLLPKLVWHKRKLTLICPRWR